MQTIREIANYLKAWRLQITGMRQEDVGVKADLSKQHYQRIESGADLKLSTLLSVLDVLGLEIRLVPKKKRVKSGHEIDNLISQAKRKVVLNLKPTPAVAAPTDAVSAEQQATKQQQLKAVFGSRLVRRKEARAAHSPKASVKIRLTSAVPSKAIKPKSEDENDEA